MFLELFNDAVINSPMFYLFFGVIIATIGIRYFVNSSYGTSMIQNCITIDETKNIKIDLSYMEKTLIINEPFIIWLIITCKRIDENDDKEDTLSSYFNNEFKIRGGQLWKGTSYSHSLESIAF